LFAGDSGVSPITAYSAAANPQGRSSPRCGASRAWSSSESVRLFVALPAVRAAEAGLNQRGFSPRRLHPRVVRVTLREARSPTLCAFQLGEPTVCHLRIWRSLSLRGARRGFPGLDGARSLCAPEEVLHLLPLCQDRSRHTPVKACDVHDPERLRLTSSQPYGWGDFLRINVEFNRLLSGYPFAYLSHPPVTVMGCLGLLRLVRTSTEVLSNAAKIPVANLCN